MPDIPIPSAIRGGEEFYVSHGSMGADETIDLAAGNNHAGTLNANCTLTFTGAKNNKMSSFTLILTQDATGGRTVVWPSSVKWEGGVDPVLTGTASSVDIFSFMSVDGGTTWYGFVAGLGMA